MGFHPINELKDLRNKLGKEEEKKNSNNEKDRISENDSSYIEDGQIRVPESVVLSVDKL